MPREIKTMTVAEYVADYNKNHEDKITRHNVYAMIKEGKLNGSKNAKGFWIIRIEKELDNNVYSPRKFTEEYNKRYKDEQITVAKVRKLAKEKKIEAKKVGLSWVILQSPEKKIEF